MQNYGRTVCFTRDWPKSPLGSPHPSAAIYDDALVAAKTRAALGCGWGDENHLKTGFKLMPFSFLIM